MYFVGIDARAQVAIILLACGPCVVIINCWDRFCTLGRAPRIKETLPDFREWCRVTRHPQVFRKLTGCQRTPWKWGVTFSLNIMVYCTRSKFSFDFLYFFCVFIVDLLRHVVVLSYDACFVGWFSCGVIRTTELFRSS